MVAGTESFEEFMRHVGVDPSERLVRDLREIRSSVTAIRKDVSATTKESNLSLDLQLDEMVAGRQFKRTVHRLSDSDFRDAISEIRAFADGRVKFERTTGAMQRLRGEDVFISAMRPDHRNDNRGFEISAKDSKTKVEVEGFRALFGDPRMNGRDTFNYAAQQPFYSVANLHNLRLETDVDGKNLKDLVPRIKLDKFKTSDN